MSRIQATVDSAIIALGALILLTLFALVRLLSGGGSDEVAAVLDSTELIGDIDPESPQEASARSIDGVDPADRSTGAFPAPIGPTDETGDNVGATSLPPDTAPDTTTQDNDTSDSNKSDSDTSDGGAADNGQAPPVDDAPDKPDDPPATTAPPKDEPSDDPSDDGGSGSNPDDDGSSKTPEDPDKPNPEDKDPIESKPDDEEPDDENPDDEPTNTAPTVWLTWSGYTLDGLTGQTTNPVTFAASDPDGDPLRFTASGMPPGLTVDPATGTITGTYTGSCTCQVTITVADGRGGSDSVGFGWTVT